MTLASVHDAPPYHYDRRDQIDADTLANSEDGSGGSARRRNRVTPTETVTVLFTDLVGSTGLAGRLGHTAYEALRAAHFDALRAAVTAHNGTEVKTTGDGLMVCFGSVGAAVGCAVAMQQAADSQMRRAPSTPVQIRVGVSVGEATRDGKDLYGPPVVEAARLCAAAQPGQILAADVVRLLSRGLGHSFAAVGEVTLKGSSTPVAVCEVGWEPLADEAAIPLPPLLIAGQQFAFAGRQCELDAMLGLWRQAQDGTRRVALIAGEPGIGKTRLAAETAALAHASGATVLYGRCDDELGVPFQPFVEALEFFIAHSPHAGLRERLGRHAGELVRLAPELAATIADLPPPLQSDAETERYRLFDAVAAWLGAASAERPLALVLDDLHWAAKPTLLLLKHILRSSSQPQPRLLIIGTYRDTELDRAHPLSAMLADLRRDPTVQRLALRGLDLAGVEAFIAGAAGHELEDPGRALARAVHAETEGNPFFVGEVLRHLGESGAVYQRDGRWVSDRSVEQLGIPEGIKEVIGRRLNRLSAAANQVLSVAAVIGRDFDLGVLASLLPVPLGEGQGEGSLACEDAVIAALDEAVRARLVHEAGAVDAYRFAHALVRDTLYGEVSASRRVRLHRRIADAIAARQPDDVIALAYHYQQAAVGGDIEKAVEYSTRAGDQARARLAYDQAVLYYRQALDLLESAESLDTAREKTWPTRDERLGPGPDNTSPPLTVSSGPSSGPCIERCELLIRLGEAQRDAGDAGFRQTLLDAAHLAQRLGDTDGLCRAALANFRGVNTPLAPVDDERIAVLTAALSALEAADTPVRARLLATLVRELTNASDRDRAKILAQEALAMARRLDDPLALGRVLAAYYMLFSTPDTLAERFAIAAEEISLAEKLGEPVERFNGHAHLIHTARDAGDIAEVDRQLAILAQLLDEIGLPSLHWVFKQHQFVRTLLAGRTADAERLMTEGFEIAQASGQPDALLMFQGQLVGVRRMQGRVAELEPLIAPALAEYSHSTGVRALAAALYCELGRDADARTLLERDAANDFADLRYDQLWLGGMLSYVCVCTHLEARDKAVVLYERLTPLHNQLEQQQGSVALYLGLLATTLERYDDANAHFAEAHAMHERIGAPYWLAVTRVEWAKMLLRRNFNGDRDRARAMLDQALATAREYGFGGVERQATQHLAP